MYGKFSPTLTYDPPGSNNLVVTGPLVAQTQGCASSTVKIRPNCGRTRPQGQVQ